MLKTKISELEPIVYTLYTVDPERPYDRVTIERTNEDPEIPWSHRSQDDGPLRACSRARIERRSASDHSIL